MMIDAVRLWKGFLISAEKYDPSARFRSRWHKTCGHSGVGIRTVAG
jgi:hypothetical protein